MLLTESFLEYLKYERNYSELTVVSYSTDLREFDEFLTRECQREVSAKEVDASLIREWMMSLMEKGVKETSVNRKLSALRSFYKYLLKKGEVTVDPTRKVNGPKKKKPLPVFLKESEMDKLLDEVDFGDDFEGCRDHMILQMFYETGMRRAELVGLNDKDVDFSGKVIKVTGKRYNYIRTKPLHLSQRIIEEAEDYAIISINVKVNKELESLILSYGDDIEVLAPDSFRTRIADKIKVMNQRYSKEKR